MIELKKEDFSISYRIRVILKTGRQEKFSLRAPDKITAQQEAKRIAIERFGQLFDYLRIS